MKILIYSDNHFCTYSSIIRSRGEKYSTRLENQIQTLNWIEQLSIKENCDAVFCLGDFFDSYMLNSEEITALKDIQWNDLPHYFLVGNHETNLSNLLYSSSNIFSGINNFRIIDHILPCVFNKFTLILLPYIKNYADIDLFKITNVGLGKKIILSHNDIKGINYGTYISTNGLDISDIENNCDLFINGHLHNGTEIKPNIINIGNVTGQNFSEDANIYKHNAIILDLDTLQIEYKENPYAFKFYKINNLEELKHKDFPQNSIVSIRCTYNDIDNVKNYISSINAIIEYKIILDFTKDKSDTKNKNIIITNSDVKKAFYNFIVDSVKSDNYEIIKEELQEVCK